MKYQYILHIDDDEEDQEIFLCAVKEISEKIHSIAMSNATEALAQLVENKICPEVIFLDLNMPVMSGQQFLAEIKKNLLLQHIPVIIFSTSSHPDTISRVKELGAHDFITKPGEYEELIQILKSTLS